MLFLRLLEGITASVSAVHELAEGGIVSKEFLVGVDGHFLVFTGIRGGEGEVFESPSVQLPGLDNENGTKIIKEVRH